MRTIKGPALLIAPLASDCSPFNGAGTALATAPALAASRNRGFPVNGWRI